MLDLLDVLPADAEGDHLGDVANDRRDGFADVIEAHVEPGGHVAATDVEADAGDRDLLLIGDHATDRLGVAEMAVGADHAGHDIADRHAVTHLLDGRRVVLAEHLQRRVLEALLLRTQHRNLRRGGIGLARELLLAGGVAIQAPGRLAAAFADAGIRIDARGEAEFAGALLVGIGSSHCIGSC